MALIPVTTSTVAGGNIPLVACATGDFANVGAGYTLIVKNGDASSHTVTVAVPGNLATGAAYPDVVYTIPAGEMWNIPMYSLYADLTTGYALLTYSALTSMTRAVLKTASAI
jgi:hypothetical protein